MLACEVVFQPHHCAEWHVAHLHSSCHASAMLLHPPRQMNFLKVQVQLASKNIKIRADSFR